MPQYQLRFLRDATVVREDIFRAPTPAAALEAARLRLGTAPPGDILVVLHDGIETARLGPRGRV